MTITGKLEISAHGDREIVISRPFRAPRELVFEALVKPELARQWLLGPEGWTLPVCEIDAKSGGKFRYVWRKQTAGDDATTVEMGMSGVFLEFDPPARTVHTELFDEDWTGGETVVTTLLEESGAGTMMRMTIVYRSQEARDGALNSGMAQGMEVSYERLEAILASR